jgi:hypothetical protein
VWLDFSPKSEAGFDPARGGTANLPVLCGNLPHSAGEVRGLLQAFFA